jgi:hypothetical protein
VSDLLVKLAGADRRSVGRVAEVVAAVLREPERLVELFEGMLADDPVLRMRAADAVEKITALHPDWLQPFKRRILREVALIEQPEVRWHVCQFFSRLTLTARERRVVYALLQNYLTAESRIVRTFAMQALADLAEHDKALRAPIVRQLTALTRTGSPAMKSRGRKLLARLRR